MFLKDFYEPRYEANTKGLQGDSIKCTLLKVAPITFWLKCINLLKCTKFCSTRKLEVADKSFGLLTKNYLCVGKKRGLKDSISGNIWVAYSNL